MLSSLSTNLPEGSHLAPPQIHEIFTRAAKGLVPAIEAIGIGNQLAEEDSSLAMAFYSAWLPSADELPTAAPILYNLGAILYNHGANAEAENVFRQALTLNPALNQCRFALARALFRRGELDAALYECRAILGIGERGQIRSKEEIEEMEAIGPVFYDTLILRSNILAAQGLIGRAERDAERVANAVGWPKDLTTYVGSLREARHALRGADAQEIDPSRYLSMMNYDIVGTCQLRCVGCPSAVNKLPTEMVKPEFLKRCLDNVDVDRIQLLRLYSFGEPLLHNDLPGVMRAVEEFRAGPVRVDIVELSTNAQKADFGQLEEVLRSGTLDCLYVSCDGDGTKERYEALRPPAKWEKLLVFLEKVAEIRDRLDLDLQLRTRNVIENGEDIDRWTEVLQPLGWKPQFRTWINLPGAPQNMTGRETVPGEGVCHFVKDRFLSVSVDGTVVPCCAHPRAGVFGNLAEMRYSEILAGEARRDFVDFLASRRAEMPICQDCED